MGRPTMFVCGIQTFSTHENAQPICSIFKEKIKKHDRCQKKEKKNGRKKEYQRNRKTCKKCTKAKEDALRFKALKHKEV